MPSIKKCPKRGEMKENRLILDWENMGMREKRVKRGNHSTSRTLGLTETGA